LKYSQQLSKYDWINFSSKQRNFYFTKSSRGPDSTSQRAGFARGPYVWQPCLKTSVHHAFVATWTFRGASGIALSFFYVLRF